MLGGLVVIGALSLYLDFINLFLLLLRPPGIESHKSGVNG